MQAFRDYLVELTARNKLLIFLGIGIFIGLFLLVVTFFVLMGGKILNGVQIEGVPVGGMNFAEAKQKLAARFDPLIQKKVVFGYEKRNFRVSLNSVGLIPDYEQSVVRAYQFGRRGSFLNRLAERFGLQRHGKIIPLSFIQNTQVLDAFYRNLEVSFAVEPVRTIVSVNAEGKVSYTGSKNGREINRKQLRQLLEKAMIRPEVESIEIPIRVVKPWLSEADVLQWKLNTVLGMYSTRFNPTLTDRVHNLQMATNAINNVILYPGESFSFNTWVGPRVVEKGYKEAPVVLLGELVPGVGGGVCQVSTTLYNAVLLANLKVVKRHNHTIPSTYVPLGRDAAVVYGGQDFVFENNLNTPILLVAAVEAPFLRVAVLGQKYGWDEIILDPVVLEKLPYRQEEEFDPALKIDERLKAQEGRDGFKVALYRMVKFQDGTVQKYLVNTSLYPARSEKFKVGKQPE